MEKDDIEIETEVEETFEDEEVFDEIHEHGPHGPHSGKHVFVRKMKGPRGPKGPMGPMGFEFGFKGRRGGKGKMGCQCMSGQGRRGKNFPVRVEQLLKGDDLKVVIFLPGIDKTSLKIRAKPTQLVVEAKNAEEFKETLGEEEISIQLNLKDQVTPEMIKAKYELGILTLTAPRVLGKEVPVE